MAYIEMPRQLATLIGVTRTIAVLIAVFFKELKITTFDPVSPPVSACRYALFRPPIVVVAIAAVAALKPSGPYW